jgi:hypothetical protein
VRTATIDWAIRWLRLPLAALGLLLAPFSLTSATASPASVETITKAEREVIDRLREQIKQLTRQSPLTVEKALAILGSQKGDGGKTTIVNFEWKLTPTDLIDGGRIGTTAGKPFVDIEPAARLGLTFEDVASMLLHAPYGMMEQQIHPFEDSLSTRTEGIYHGFLVPAGVLKIYLRATIPYTEHNQMASAWGEGRDAAEGVAPANTRRLTSVVVTARVGSLGEQPKTLAKLRATAAARRARARN